MSKIIIGLVKGRHEMPVNEYIFDKVNDVFDYDEIRNQIHHKLQKYNEVDLYVTGLTTVLIEVINYCIINNLNLTLLHYNYETHGYMSQIVHSNFWAAMLREEGYI